MSINKSLMVSSKNSTVSWFDLCIISIIMIIGFIYLNHLFYWGIGFIGDVQFGDAQFWWSGAVQIAQGIFSDNPGKGFRPGYFLLSGLTLPVLGTQFKQFFPYFLLTFLTASSFFYLALRLVLGRFIAACCVFMLVFNPYTAEWVSTSTTDSTGLLLNLLALSCLLIGINKQFHRGWLAGFALFFALATLTRPLITPFIGVVFLILFLVPKMPFKKRLITVLIVFTAFCAPTLLWMFIQKLTINQWSVSSNDASAFYAASDPNIQVWNRKMYDPIQEKAAKYFHVSIYQVDEKKFNQMFWHETLQNYVKYSDYHLKRLLPNIWVFAKFSPKLAVHGTEQWRMYLLELIAIGLLIFLILEKKWVRALCVTILAVMIYILPMVVAWMTLAGAALTFLTYRRDRIDKLGALILGAYWVTGVFALYLVGATFGPPTFQGLSLDALGYRIGSQLFFVGDVLAVYCLMWLANKNFNKFCYQGSYLASGIVTIYCGIFLLSIMIIYSLGISMVYQRAYARSHAKPHIYPPLNSFLTLYQQRFKTTPINVSQIPGLNNDSITSMADKDVDVLFTGAVSSFIWNMPGQERAQMMVYPQKQIQPFAMGPEFIMVEVPQHVEIKKWEGMQGVFVVHPLLNHHNESNQLYYYSSLPVKAFVPLAADQEHFSLNEVKWFPLVKNAAQLEASNELMMNAKVQWSQDSGETHFKRRFFLVPKTSDGKLRLSIHVNSVQAPAVLSFSYALDKIPGTKYSVGQGNAGDYLPEKNYDMNIFIQKQASNKYSQSLILQKMPAEIMELSKIPLKDVVFPVPNNTRTVEIVFNDLLPNTGVWLYEFNLKAMNFHSLKKN